MTYLFRLRLEVTATLDSPVVGPNDYRVPEGVKIPVEVSDGEKAFAVTITSDMLQAAPDYSRDGRKDGRKAWLCRNLLKTYVPPGTALEVDAADAPGGPKFSIRAVQNTSDAAAVALEAQRSVPLSCDRFAPPTAMCTW